MYYFTETTLKIVKDRFQKRGVSFWKMPISALFVRGYIFVLGVSFGNKKSDISTTLSVYVAIFQDNS